MNKKNIRVVIVVVAVVSFLVASSFWPRRPVEFDSGHRLIMGTFARIVVVAVDSGTAKNCIEIGFEQLELVDNSMSDYKDDSQLSRVNRYAYRETVKVGEPLFEVLQKSIEFSKLTDGAFDVTVGPLVDLFRSSKQKGIAPGEDKIARAKSKVGFEKLKLDEQNRTVRFAIDGMRLDLGGIAKGYAIDKAIEAMQSSGAIGAMVDVGGDIRCFGTPSGNKECWLIGLQDPNEAQGDIAVGPTLLTLKLSDAAIATSGDYRRFTLIDDKKYSHIMDRKSGTSTAGLSSVTIIADSAIDADALATAVSVMGAQKGFTLIETIPNAEAILILSQKPYELIKTSGAEKYIK